MRSLLENSLHGERISDGDGEVDGNIVLEKLLIRAGKLFKKVRAAFHPKPNGAPCWETQSTHLGLAHQLGLSFDCLHPSTPPGHAGGGRRDLVGVVGEGIGRRRSGQVEQRWDMDGGGSVSQ